jgi:hypothetical protein
MVNSPMSRLLSWEGVPAASKQHDLIPVSNRSAVNLYPSTKHDWAWHCFHRPPWPHISADHWMRGLWKKNPCPFQTVSNGLWCHQFWVEVGKSYDDGMRGLGVRTEIQPRHKPNPVTLAERVKHHTTMHKLKCDIWLSNYINCCVQKTNLDFIAQYLWDYILVVIGTDNLSLHTI